MIKTFGAPHRYLQGPGAFDKLGDIARAAAGRAIVVIDADVLTFVKDRLAKSFGGDPHLVLSFRGEITVPAIEALTRDARDFKGDIVIGIGGGKALDASKGVAKRLDLRTIAVPTIASNDSPTGRSMAIYDDHHTLVLIESVPRSPEAVIVDTALIAQAPTRFLLCGMGDAIAKKFEAEAALRDGSLNFLDSGATRTALIVADGCYRTLREHGVAAIAANNAHEVTPALEAVVEANILMAGFAWESGGLSMAHAVVRGLTRARGAEKAAHGLHVAYGLLVQLMLEGRDAAFLDDLSAFYRAVGFPLSLGALGMTDPTNDELKEIARLTTIGPKGGKITVTFDEAAIHRALSAVEDRAKARA